MARRAAILSLWCVLGGPIASAQAPDAPGGSENSDAEVTTGDRAAGAPQTSESVEAAQAARRHFLRGMEHFEARRYRDAVHEFQLAARLVPSADLWFNIARAYEELHDEPSLRQAVEYYRRYLRDRMDPPDREAVEARIEALEERIEAARQARLERPRTGTLRVRSSLAGASVRVGEQSLGRTPVPTPVDLPPGRHRVEVRREGYVPFRAEVEVAAGVPVTAYADLVPQTRYRAVRGRRIFTWIVGALGVAALGTSVGFGVKARAEDDLDAARQLGRRSDYLLGAAAVLAVGATILYFVEGRAVGTERVDTPPEAEPASDEAAARAPATPMAF